MTKPITVYGLKCPELGSGLHDFVTVEQAEAREQKYREALEPLRDEAMALWGATSDYARDDEMEAAIIRATAALHEER